MTIQLIDIGTRVIFRRFAFGAFIPDVGVVVAAHYDDFTRLSYDIYIGNGEYVRIQSGNIIKTI